MHDVRNRAEQAGISYVRQTGVSLVPVYLVSSRGSHGEATIDHYDLSFAQPCGITSAAATCRLEAGRETTPVLDPVAAARIRAPIALTHGLKTP
nr:hypothetical protein CFP56_08123 [Quercus suber]